MFRAGDNLVLQRPRQVAEVVAVASHADNEIAVLIGGGQGFAQRRRRDDVELEVVPAEPEVRADELRELLDAVLPLKRVKLAVSSVPSSVNGVGRMYQVPRRFTGHSSLVDAAPTAVGWRQLAGGGAAQGAA